MKKQLRQLFVTLLAAFCAASVTHAAAVSHTVNFDGVLSGNSPTGEVFTLSQSFVDASTSTTVNFDVLVTLDWIDSTGASVAGIGGSVFGNGTTLGANTQFGITGNDSGDVETVNAISGEAVMERLTFTIANLTPGNFFTGFSNPTGNIDDEMFAGTTTFSITPGATGFRVGSIDANFETSSQAVPEPGTWMTFLLIGGLLVRAIRKQQ